MDNDYNPMKRNKFPRDTYIIRIKNGSCASNPKKLPEKDNNTYKKDDLDNEFNF